MKWFKNLFKNEDSFEKQKEENFKNWRYENKISYNMDLYDFDQVSEIILNNDPEIKWNHSDYVSSLYGWTHYEIILTLNNLSLDEFRYYFLNDPDLELIKNSNN